MNKILGYMYYAGNNIQTNNINISLLSSYYYGNAQGFYFIPTNFRKVVALFTARKTIKTNWINSKDEYLQPKKGV